MPIPTSVKNTAGDSLLPRVYAAPKTNATIRPAQNVFEANTKITNAIIATANVTTTNVSVCSRSAIYTSISLLLL